MGQIKSILGRTMDTIPQLHEDVVLNILSRLPVKYLIQLKCVCKSWRSLISDPHFAKLQLAQSKNSNNLKCDRFIFVSNPIRSIDRIDYADLYHNLDHVNHLEYPAVMKNVPEFDKFVYDVQIVGSCNGLVCVLFMNGHIFLWNPTIRAALELPSSAGFDSNDYFLCGLGYDSSVDDYKVVKARHPGQHVDGAFSVSFEILASKSNIWRKVKETEHKSDYLFKGLRLPQSGVFLHGGLHWMAKRPLNIFVILVFNVIEEEFYELVELPDSNGETDILHPVLTDSGDSLVLFYEYLNLDDLDAWKLNEYGVESSWTKFFSKRCTIPEFGCWGSVLHYTKTGEIILYYGNGSFLWYDTEGNSCMKITPPQVDLDQLGSELVEYAIYVESLVLPDWYRPAQGRVQGVAWGAQATPLI